MRYRCPVCPDWDYCSVCVAKSALTHPMHQFIPLRDVSPMLELPHKAEEAHSGPVNVILDPEEPMADIMRKILDASGRLPGHRPYVFKYSPLNPSENTIRLVALLPGRGERPVKCKIAHAILNEGLRYEALSYTWGDPKHACSIFVENQPFPVRENLFNALCHLRFQSDVRYLWVDALCIDQMNDEEKSVQVQRMTSIYKQAARVLVWLGTSEDESDMAMDLVVGDLTAGSLEAELPQDFLYYFNDEDESSNNIRLDADTDTKLCEDSFHATSEEYGKETWSTTGLPSQLSEFPEDAELPEEFEYYSDGDEDPSPMRSSSLKDAHETAWAALMKLVFRPWWSRVWCLQEICVPSSEPVILCGHRMVGWDEFQKVCALNLGATIPLIERSWQPLRVMTNSQTQSYQASRVHIQTKNPTMSIQLLLISTMKLQFTDPRDKVFALVGLSHEIDQKALAPNYSKNVIQVYTETIRHIIDKTKQLNLLCYNTNSQNPHPDLKLLPSWVPDWTLLTSRPYCIWNSDVYNASKSQAAAVFPSDSPSVVILGGFMLDKVSVVSESMMSDNTWRTENPSGLRKTLEKLEKMVLRFIGECTAFISYPMEDKADLDTWWQRLGLDPDPRNSDAFWRTLIANKFRMPEGYVSPAPENYAEMFEILRYSSSAAPRRRLSQVLTSVEVRAPRLRIPNQSHVPATFKPHLPPMQRTMQYIAPLVEALMVLQDRQLFITQQGLIGLASKGIKPGDLVAVLCGGDMPFILRPRNDGEPLRFISEFYVHGMMNGEALSRISDENLKNCMYKFALR